MITLIFSLYHLQHKYCMCNCETNQSVLKFLHVTCKFRHLSLYGSIWSVKVVLLESVK